MKKTTIYNLNLHETHFEDVHMSITRVPGGWIYEILLDEEELDGKSASTVFVPYNEEFKNK